MSDVTKTVKPSGGDYSSLNAALAGMSGNLTNNCGGTGSAGILTIECYAMEDTTAASTGTGYTTSASYYINIVVPQNERHNGKWSITAYRLAVSSSSNCLASAAAYMKVLGLQFSMDYVGSANYPRGISVSNGTALLEIAKCIFRKTGGETAYACFGINNPGSSQTYTVNVFNCLFYDFIKTGGIAAAIRIDSGANQTINAYNCTVYNSTYGFCSSGSVGVWKNCGAASCITAAFSSGTQTTCSSTTPTFVDEAGDDFHLASSDVTWKDQGTDLSGTFTDDIDGQTRSGSWDIGADEYVATPPAWGGPASAAAEALDPTVQVGGGMTVDLASVPAALAVEGLDPVSVLGSTSDAPPPAEALAEGANPSAVLGSVLLDLSGDPAYSAAQAIDPQTLLASLNLTPAMAAALAEAQPPAVVLGALVLTVPHAEALPGAVDPLVILGALVLSPELAAVLAECVDPTIQGSGVIVDLTALPGAAATSAIDPAVLLGPSIADLSSAPAEAAAGAQPPVLILGSIPLTPLQAQALAEAISPQVDVGALLVDLAGQPAAAAAQAQDPLTVLGPILLTPAQAEAIASGTDPAAVLGLIVLFPAPAVVAGEGGSPTIVIVGATEAALHIFRALNRGRVFQAQDRGRSFKAIDRGRRFASTNRTG